MFFQTEDQAAVWRNTTLDMTSEEEDAISGLKAILGCPSSSLFCAQNCLYCLVCYRIDWTLITNTLWITVHELVQIDSLWRPQNPVDPDLPGQFYWDTNYKGSPSPSPSLPLHTSPSTLSWLPTHPDISSVSLCPIPHSTIPLTTFVFCLGSTVILHTVLYICIKVLCHTLKFVTICLITWAYSVLTQNNNLNDNIIHNNNKSLPFCLHNGPMGRGLRGGEWHFATNWRYDFWQRIPGLRCEMQIFPFKHLQVAGPLKGYIFTFTLNLGHFAFSFYPKRLTINIFVRRKRNDNLSLSVH